MKLVSWLLIIFAAGGLVFAFRRWRQRWDERQRAAESRLTSFIAQASPGLQPAPGTQVAPAAPAAPPAIDASARLQQQLLLEAASKTAQAGEPALSIQIYARLLSRYPESPLAAQARAAVEEQKRKIAKL